MIDDDYNLDALLKRMCYNSWALSSPQEWIQWIERMLSEYSKNPIKGFSVEWLIRNQYTDEKFPWTERFTSYRSSIREGLRSTHSIRRGNSSDHFSSNSSGERSRKEPLAEVIDAGHELRVVLEIPQAAKKEEIDLTLNNDRSLTISVGEHGERLHRKMTLPEDVRPDGARASFKNGILEVVFPKVNNTRNDGVHLKID